MMAKRARVATPSAMTPQPQPTTDHNDRDFDKDLAKDIDDALHNYGIDLANSTITVAHGPHLPSAQLGRNP